MVVMTALKDERLNKLLVDHRVSTGLEAIERGKATIKLMKGLKSGRIVLILIDQDTRVKSRFIKFLGIPAATPIGGTLMAQRTGASVLPMHITLQPDRSQLINIGPEVEIQHTDDEEQDLLVNTQRISDTTEQAILRNPAQWVWMHERWKTQPGEEIK
jgi:KDO2-lipid IV(A) lauroyltransferase